MLQERHLPRKDAVHTINYQAVDPDMNPAQQEAFRVTLLTYHIDFEGMKLVAGSNRNLRSMIRTVSQGNPAFAGYAKWRLTTDQTSFPLQFP
jgi:hypothetical protein